MVYVAKLLLVICLASISGCSTLQSISTGGNPTPPTVTPAEVPNEYEVGQVVTSSTTIDRVIAVEPVTLPNCNGSSDLTVRRTFTQEVDRVPELMNFDAARFNVSAQTVIGVVNAGIGVDPSEGSPLTESYELEMSAAPGTSVEYNVQWILSSRTGVIEFNGENDVVYVEFTVPQTLRALTEEPQQFPCEEATAAIS